MPTQRGKLADRDPISGHDEGFALVKLAHDLAAVIAKLTLGDLSGHIRTVARVLQSDARCRAPHTDRASADRGAVRVRHICLLLVSLTKRMPTRSGHDLLEPAIRYGPSVRNPPRHIVAPVHHDAVMLGCAVRTTIDLPDDLHKQAQAIARDTHRTLSETVADLVRRGLRAGSTTALSKDPRTGLPLVSVGTVVTSEDVRSLEDEE